MRGASNKDVLGLDVRGPVGAPVGLPLGALLQGVWSGSAV